MLESGLITVKHHNTGVLVGHFSSF